MREIPLAQVLTPAPDPVPLRADVEYQTAGILSYGRGLFARPVKSGLDISYSTYYRLRAGQFVYSRLFAWEGALAVVPHAFDGCFVSQEFPAFQISGGAALPEYVGLLCRWPEVWDRMAAVVSGMGGRRKRVHPKALLSLSVPLPPLAEQRRIVDLIGAVDEAAALARASASAAATALVSFLDDLATPSSGSVVRPTGLLALSVGGDWGGDPGTGEVDLPVYRQTEFTDVGLLSRPAGAIRSLSVRKFEKRRLRPRDILLQKSAGTPSLPGRVVRCPDGIEEAVPSNFLQLLRPDPAQCSPAFLFWHLWRTHRVGIALDYQAGTNIRNLDVGRYLEREFVLPDRSEQERVAATADELQGVMLRAVDVERAIAALRSALLADLLSGDHEIPPSYDRFLDGVA